MEPRRMIPIRIHAIARRVNDGSSPIAQLRNHVVYPGSKFGQTPDGCHGMMRVPHVAQNDRGLRRIPLRAFEFRVEPPAAGTRFNFGAKL